jgi:hypothetical protein
LPLVNTAPDKTLTDKLVEKRRFAAKVDLETGFSISNVQNEL